MTRTPESDKFSPATLALKDMLRAWRIAQNKTMTCLVAAGVSRKKLEDFEAVRDYGCFFSFDDLTMFCREYGLTMKITGDDVSISGPSADGTETDDTLFFTFKEAE